MTARKSTRGTRLVIWSAFALCTVTSVTFNALHTALLTRLPVALVIAGVWPLTAVLAVEVLTRVPWARGRMWQLARFGGVGTVAVGAMVISYTHTYAVLTHWGESPVTAAVGPLVIDGLMTLSGAALLAMHTRKPPVRRRRTTTTRKPRLKAA